MPWRVIWLASTILQARTNGNQCCATCWSILWETWNNVSDARFRARFRGTNPGRKAAHGHFPPCRIDTFPQVPFVPRLFPFPDSRVDDATRLFQPLRIATYRYTRCNFHRANSLRYRSITIDDAWVSRLETWPRSGTDSSAELVGELSNEIRRRGEKVRGPTCISDDTLKRESLPLFVPLRDTRLSLSLSLSFSPSLAWPISKPREIPL